MKHVDVYIYIICYTHQVSKGLNWWSSSYTSKYIIYIYVSISISISLYQFLYQYIYIHTPIYFFYLSIWYVPSGPIVVWNHLFFDVRSASYIALITAWETELIYVSYTSFPGDKYWLIIPDFQHPRLHMVAFGLGLAPSENPYPGRGCESLVRPLDIDPRTSFQNFRIWWCPHANCLVV